MDSLAQIITQANIQATSRALVVESCSGLVIGAVLERLAGFGSVVHLYTGTAPNRPALTDGYNFPPAILKSLHSFPLNEANTLGCTSVAANVTDVNTAESICNDTPVVESSGKDIGDVKDSDAGEDSRGVDTCVDSNINQVSETYDQMESRKESETASGGPIDTLSSSLTDKSSDKSSSTPSDISKDTLSDKQTSGRSRSRNRNRGSAKHSRSESNEHIRKKRKLDECEEREQRRLMRLEQIKKAKEVVESGNMDCLIVATKFHPTPIVLRLLEFVAPSRPIVVFSPYKEPLLDCFMKLKETNRVLMIKLSETWLRSYQVLPDRTHPSINMSGGGGYMLTAMTVEPEQSSK